MKNLKKFFCLLSIAAMLLTCTGCIDEYLVESKTDVLLKLAETVDGRTPTAATVTLDFAMHAEHNGVPADITVFLKNSTLTESETDSYAEGEWVCNFNGQELRDNAQVYNFAEDGKLLTFTHVDSKNLWLRSETALQEQQSAPTVTPAPESDDTQEAEVSIPEAYRFLLLEEGTQNLNDTEVYVLTGSVEGEDCKAFLLDSLNLDALTGRLHKLAPESTDLSSIDLDTLDYSALTADVVVYLNKSDCSLNQIEVTLNGANLLITDLLTMLPDHISALFGSAVSVQPIHVVFSDISFDAVVVPTVSEEARLMATQEGFNPDRGDGSYVLQLRGDAIKYTAQTDLTLTQLGSAYAAFQNGNNSRAVHMELYQNTTAEDFFSLVENGMIPAMEAHELSPVTTSESPIGDFQTHSITSNGVNIYSACRTVGNSLLGIYVQDSSGADFISVLTPILNSIEEYEFES